MLGRPLHRAGVRLGAGCAHGEEAAPSSRWGCVGRLRPRCDRGRAGPFGGGRESPGLEAAWARRPRREPPGRKAATRRGRECGYAEDRAWRAWGRPPGLARPQAAAPPPPLFPHLRAEAGGAHPRAEGLWGTLIHVRQRRGGAGGVGGGGGGGAASAGSSTYAGR
jgi:hypothetical protein